MLRSRSSIFLKNNVDFNLESLTVIVSFSNIDLYLLYIKDFDYYSSRMFMSSTMSQSLFKLKLMKGFVLICWQIQ